MKRFVFYPGCVMPTEQYAYELSIREIMPKLDIELIDVKGFSCCGEPMKSVNQLMTIYLSARNIAIASEKGKDMFIPCPMCHLSLSECKKIMKNDFDIKNKIDEMLSKENLTYDSSINIYNTLDLIHDFIGIDKIKKLVKKPLNNKKIATHYGCHLIRPSEVGRPDDSENPQKMENILKAIGADPVDYPEKLDCCGAMIHNNLPESALTKTGQKLASVQNQGFDIFVDTCPWCHRMFDSKQKKAGDIVASKLNIPVVYLTQILGLSFGIDSKKLGFDLNLSPTEKIENGGK
jgi:heterodisulfide reductase subunit B